MRGLFGLFTYQYEVTQNLGLNMIFECGNIWFLIWNLYLGTLESHKEVLTYEYMVLNLESLPCVLFIKSFRRRLQ